MEWSLFFTYLLQAVIALLVLSLPAGMFLSGVVVMAVTSVWRAADRRDAAYLPASDSRTVFRGERP